MHYKKNLQFKKREKNGFNPLKILLKMFNPIASEITFSNISMQTSLFASIIIINWVMHSISCIMLR